MPVPVPGPVLVFVLGLGLGASSDGDWTSRDMSKVSVVSPALVHSAAAVEPRDMSKSVGDSSNGGRSESGKHSTLVKYKRSRLAKLKALAFLLVMSSLSVCWIVFRSSCHLPATFPVRH